MNYGLSPSFNAVVDSIYRNVKINPYSKKVSQKMSGPTKKFVESAITGNVNRMSRKMNEEDVMKLKSELMELNIPVDNIDDQLRELTRKRNNKGALAFDLGLGNAFRKSNSAVLVAPTGSGKTVCIFGSLIFEITNPFDTIIYFSGKSSYENQHVQTFKAICKRVTAASYDGEQTKEQEPLMKFLWYNTNADDRSRNKKLNDDVKFFNGSWDEFKKTQINKDGSIKSLYMSKYGSVYVFDDLQNLKTKDPVYRLMDDIAVKGRHQLINWFVTFQTAYRLNANIVSNCDKLFISKLSITDDNVWNRVKEGKPTNLKECIDEPNQPRFWYIDNNCMHPYFNLEFTDLSQVIAKLKSKLPAPLLDEEKKKQYMQTSKIIEAYERQQGLNAPQERKTEKIEPVKVKEEDVPSYNRTNTKDILNGLVDMRRRRGVRLFPD